MKIKQRRFHCSPRPRDPKQSLNSLWSPHHVKLLQKLTNKTQSKYSRNARVGEAISLIGMKDKEGRPFLGVLLAKKQCVQQQHWFDFVPSPQALVENERIDVSQCMTTTFKVMKTMRLDMQMYHCMESGISLQMLLLSILWMND